MKCVEINRVFTQLEAHMFSEDIRMFRQKGLYRQMADRATPQGRLITISDCELVNFSSNDYLGLADWGGSDEEISSIIGEFGFGAGASRLMSGGTSMHGRLEETLARFKGTESSLIFNSGYMANVGVIPALAREGWTIFSDELNHASIIDGCRLSRARRVLYRHCDVEDLQARLRAAGRARKLVVTESIFSMDGDVAHIAELHLLCRAENALLYIDDAHGTGVLGEGRGVCAHFGIPDPNGIIQMGTLSKALGSFGAFVASSAETVEFLVNTARTLIFSTALPPVVIAMALQSIRRIEEDQSLIETLWKRVRTLHRGLEAIGVDKGRSETQIVPILCDDVSEAVNLSAYLRREGIYAPAIRPPSVRRPRVRLSISAVHTEGDIEQLLDSVGRYRDWRR